MSQLHERRLRRDDDRSWEMTPPVGDNGDQDGLSGTSADALAEAEQLADQRGEADGKKDDVEKLAALTVVLLLLGEWVFASHAWFRGFMTPSGDAFMIAILPCLSIVAVVSFLGGAYCIFRWTISLSTAVQAVVASLEFWSPSSIDFLFARGKDGRFLWRVPNPRIVFFIVAPWFVILFILSFNEHFAKLLRKVREWSQSSTAFSAIAIVQGAVGLIVVFFENVPYGAEPLIAFAVVALGVVVAVTDNNCDIIHYLLVRFTRLLRSGARWVYRRGRDIPILARILGCCGERHNATPEELAQASKNQEYVIAAWEDTVQGGPRRAFWV